jgi:hypothetical protein
LMIIAWSKVLPIIRKWLKRRGGRATLEFIKACCLDDAKGRVKNPEELVAPLVKGHCGVVFSPRFDIEAIGPYCVTIQVPERTSTFVYVTDEVGNILHFHEVPAPELEDVVPEESVAN